MSNMSYHELLKAHAALEAAIVQAKADAKAAKLQAAEDKRLKAIARTEARLQKLLSNQVGKVGAKAAKANRKAGPVTIVTGALAAAAVTQ